MRAATFSTRGGGAAAALETAASPRSSFYIPQVRGSGRLAPCEADLRPCHAFGSCAHAEAPGDQATATPVDWAMRSGALGGGGSASRCAHIVDIRDGESSRDQLPNESAR